MFNLLAYIKNLFRKPPKVTQTPAVKNAEYWDNKWPRSEVTFKARGKYSMDVRNLILSRSYIIERAALSLAGKNSTGTNYDEMARNLHKFVVSHLTYKSDDVLYATPEYWQDPEITQQSGMGDCEDGALLLASLMRCAGIPAYRVKICAGWVYSKGKQEGHCYVIYLADDDKWYVLDWCYWASESLAYYLKVPHDQQTDKYKDIWWTANDEFTWAQTTTHVIGS